MTLLCESRRFRVAVLTIVLTPVLYVASFGPACRLGAVPTGRIPQNTPTWLTAYRPLCEFTDRYDGSFFSEAILHWASFWIPRGSMIVVPMAGERKWVTAN